MRRLQLHFRAGFGPADAIESVDVPDIATALVVADIMAPSGTLEIRAGDVLLAKVQKQPNEGAPFWRVG